MHQGAGWESLGTVSSVGAGIPSLQFDASGNPVVAWEQLRKGGNTDLYLKRWNGSAWVEVGGAAPGGGISNDPYISGSPSLAIDASGNPAVAWHRVTDFGSKILFRRWNPSIAMWEEVGGSATGAGVSAPGLGSYFPSLAFDPSGNPLIAWEEIFMMGPEEKREIFLRRWTGSEWVELDGSASGTTEGGISRTATGGSTQASLAVDSNALPWVAWTEQPDDLYSEIYLRRWFPSVPYTIDLSK
jgi:hypothetical protein